MRGCLTARNARPPSYCDRDTHDCKSRPAPFRVAVTCEGHKGLILLDQLRAVDKVRLAKRFGAVSTKTLVGTLGTLWEVFAE